MPEPRSKPHRFLKSSLRSKRGGLRLRNNSMSIDVENIALNRSPERDNGTKTQPSTPGQRSPERDNATMTDDQPVTPGKQAKQKAIVPDNVSAVALAWYRKRIASQDLPDDVAEDTVIQVQYHSSEKYPMYVSATIDDIIAVYTELRKQHLNNVAMKQALAKGRQEQAEKIAAGLLLDDVSKEHLMHAASTTMRTASAALEAAYPTPVQSDLVAMTIGNMSKPSVPLVQVLKMKANKKKKEEEKMKAKTSVENDPSV